MTKGRAYISGKMTGLEDLNRPKFESAATILRDFGYTPVNPHEVTKHIPADWSWEHFMRADITELMKCNFLFVLDDWHKSKGAQIEVELALNIGIPVYEVETMKLLPWKAKVFTEVNGVLLNVRS